MRQYITAADKILMVVSACLIVASYVFANAVAVQGSVVVIQVDGVTVHKALLSETQRITVKGVHGELIVETRERKVAITQADCPNHICVKTGWRSRSGEVIVCVPNKALVRIIAADQKGVRATTG